MRVIGWGDGWTEFAHYRESEKDREVCLTETGQGKEKQFIFMLL